MKDKAIVLVDADGDCVGPVLEAAARTGHAVWLNRGSREALNVLREKGDEIAGVVVDLDPGAHGFALLEAMSGFGSRPPIIALTGWEESLMAPVAKRHGAAECIGKPFAIVRLETAIKRRAGKLREKVSCDLWGHPLPTVRRRQEAKVA